MKKYIISFLSIVALLLFVTCQENDIILSDVPSQPEEPSGEDVEAFIEDLAEDLVDVMSEVDVLIEGCNSMDDVAQRLAAMNQIEGLEDVYISDDYLYVKSNGVNLSWSFYKEPDDDADDEFVDESLKACCSVIQKSAANSNKEHEFLNKGNSKDKLKVCIANQQADDKERDKYKVGYNKLKDNFEKCGFNVTLLEAKQVSVGWFFSKIFDYDIIFLVAHGGAAGEMYVQMSGEEISGKTDKEKEKMLIDNYRFFYSSLLDNTVQVPDVSKCRNYIGFHTTKGMKTQDGDRDVTNVVLSENIVPLLKGRFDKAVIFNTSCRSMYNHNFAKKLIAKGAVAYLGYNYDNDIGKEAGPEFFANMLKGMTVKQAFDKLPFKHRFNVYEGVLAKLEYVGNDNVDDVCIVHPEVTTDSADVDGTTVVLKGCVKGTNSLMKCEAAFCYSENAGDFKLGMQGVDSTDWKPFDGDWKNDVEFSDECKDFKLNTKYYYRAVVKTEDNYFYSEVKSFETEKNDVEFVDLGLSVLWARCNVGASTPEEFGGYYAWGEVSEKSSYTKDNYLGWCGDVATCFYGDARMPTSDELQELVDNCVWVKYPHGDVRGYEVVGPNGNSIFLPAAGYKFLSYHECVGEYGRYWSSTGSSFADEYAYQLKYAFPSYNVYNADKYHGGSVRAVREK